MSYIIARPSPEVVMASPQQKQDLAKLQEATRLMAEAKALLEQLSVPARREHNVIIGREMLDISLDRLSKTRELAHFGVHNKLEGPS